jgi:hypothetical protein
MSHARLSYEEETNHDAAHETGERSKIVHPANESICVAAYGE